jgi:hypothetical protein
MLEWRNLQCLLPFGVSMIQLDTQIVCPYHSYPVIVVRDILVEAYHWLRSRASRNVLGCIASLKQASEDLDLLLIDKSRDTGSRKLHRRDGIWRTMEVEMCWVQKYFISSQSSQLVRVVILTYTNLSSRLLEIFVLPIGTFQINTSRCRSLALSRFSHKVWDMASSSASGSSSPS